MIVDLEKPTINELMHWGILGMRWGVRKDRKESASVSRAREALKVRKKEYDSAIGSDVYSTESMKLINDTSREYEYSKQDLAKAKILDKLSKKEKSKSQLSLEAQYKEKGYTDEEAAVAAYQRIKTNRILIAVGATAVVAAAGYAAYKIHDDRVDKLIKSGTILQNVAADDTVGVRDAFYSSKNALDNAKYRGLYGQRLHENEGAAYQKSIKVFSDIKQASYKSARDTLSEVANSDPEFAKNLKTYMDPYTNRLGPQYAGKMRRAQKSLAKGIVDKNVYEVFNAALVDHDSSSMQVNSKKFFDALGRKGYNAIKDVNDAKYSGYKSLNPIIVFGSKGKVDVINVKKLTEKEIARAGNISYAHIFGSSLVKQGAAITAGMIGAKTVSSAAKRRRERIRIEAYKKDNPGTKLSNTEIIRMLERNDWSA